MDELLNNLNNDWRALHAKWMDAATRAANTKQEADQLLEKLHQLSTRLDDLRAVRNEMNKAA